MKPDIIANWRDIEAESSSYPGTDEKHAVVASFARHFGLRRLGIHHERLPPGRRLAWPHAEADEEEFVLVLEGEPDLWVDGRLYRLKEGDGVGFVAGTGIAHTFLNNTDRDVRFLVIGEATRESSRVHYPVHPHRNAEIGQRWWKDAPHRERGPHDGLPDAQRKKS